MNAAHHLFGTYQPLETPIHRTPLSVKALSLLTLTALLTLTSQWSIAAAVLVIVIALGTLAQIPVMTWVQALRSLAWLLGFLLLYYWYTGTLARGADTLLGLLSLLFAAKVLLWSTPLPVIIDGFIWLCSPLRHLGISPQGIGLALALMIRSIPTIIDTWSFLQESVTARGLKVSRFRLFIPLVISTVSYAQDTGDALAARGLDSR